MTAPTQQQLRILRLLAAGVELREGPRIQGHLVFNGIVVSAVRAHSLEAMVDAEWVAFDDALERYVLTAAGRKRTEVGTFVRAFAEGV